MASIAARIFVTAPSAAGRAFRRKNGCAAWLTQMFLCPYTGCRNVPDRSRLFNAPASPDGSSTTINTDAFRLNDTLVFTFAGILVENSAAPARTASRTSLPPALTPRRNSRCVTPGAATASFHNSRSDCGDRRASYDPAIYRVVSTDTSLTWNTGLVPDPSSYASNVTACVNRSGPGTFT